MKAFIGLYRDSAPQVGRSTPHVLWMLAAENEARAILRESEPNPREGGARYLMSPLACPYSVALAESLAAFLELDIS